MPIMREHEPAEHDQRVSPKTCLMASASMEFQIGKDIGGGSLLHCGSTRKMIHAPPMALQRTAVRTVHSTNGSGNTTPTLRSTVAVPAVAELVRWRARFGLMRCAFAPLRLSVLTASSSTQRRKALLRTRPSRSGCKRGPRGPGRGAWTLSGIMHTHSPGTSIGLTTGFPLESQK